MKSRIDFFLIEKKLAQYFRKVDIQASIAPIINMFTYQSSRRICQHEARDSGNLTIVYSKMKLTSNWFRTHIQISKEISECPWWATFLGASQNGIRISAISFAKKKAKINREREIFVKDLLDELDEKICLSDNLLNVEQELKQYDNLKKRTPTANIRS